MPEEKLKIIDEKGDDVEIPKLNDRQMTEMVRNILILIALGVINDIRKVKYDKKEFAADLESLVQVVTTNIAEKNETEDLAEYKK